MTNSEDLFTGLTAARGLLVFGVVACHRDTAAPRAMFEQVAAELPVGISDVTVDDRDHLWAIAERERVVAEIVISGSPPQAQVFRHPPDGVPRGVDTEAITFLGSERFAVGTEGHDEPAAGVMFGERRADGHIHLVPGFSLSSRVELLPNQGVEALCGRGPDLVVGLEVSGVLPDGARYSPIVRIRGASPVV